MDSESKKFSGLSVDYGARCAGVLEFTRKIGMPNTFDVQIGPILVNFDAKWQIFLS